MPSTAQLTFASSLGGMNSRAVLTALEWGAAKHTQRIQPALAALGDSVNTTAHNIDAAFTGLSKTDIGAPQPPGGWSKDPAMEWAQRIAYGHSWEKNHTDFPGYSQDDLADLVHKMMTTPGNMVGKGVNPKGKEVEVMYRDGVVVILDPDSDDMGTVYRPTSGLNNFINLRSYRTRPNTDSQGLTDLMEAGTAWWI